MDTHGLHQHMGTFQRRVEKAIFSNGHSNSEDGPFIVDGKLSLAYTCDKCDKDVRTIIDFRTDQVTQEGDADTTPCG
jgi:hypothetical protein